MKHNKYRLLYSSALVLSPLMNGTLGDVADTDEQSHYADRYGTDAQGQDSIISAIESNNAELRDTVRKTVQRIIQLDGISTKATDTLHNIIIAGITGSIAGIKDLEELHATGDTEPADLLSFLQQLQAWLTGSYPQNASQALSTLKSQIAVQYPPWNIPMLPPESPTDNVETIHQIGQFETEYGTGMNLPISSNLNEFIGKNVTFKLVNQDTKKNVDRFDYAVKLDGIKRYTEEGVIVLPSNNEIRVLDLAAGNYTLDITGGTKTDRYDLVVHPKKIEVNLEAEGKIYTGTTDAVLRVTSSGILKRDVKDVHVIARGTFPSAQKGDYEVSVNDYRLEGAKRHNYILLPWSGQLNASILKRSHNSGNPNPPQNTSIYVTMNVSSPTNDPTPTITGTCEAGTTVEVTLLAEDGSFIQTSVTVESDGTWRVTPDNPLTDGTYTISATATDAAGNTKTATATETFTIPIVIDSFSIVDTTGTVETNLPTGQVLKLYSSGNLNSDSDSSGTYAFTVTSGAATDDYYVDVSAVNVNGANDIWLGSTLTQVMAQASATPTLHVMSGHSGLTALRLVGTDTTLPTWAKNGSLTAANATLDLSEMTGLGNPLDLSSIHNDITDVVLPTTVTEITVPSTVTVQLASGHSGLTRINLTGSDPTIPVWATNGSLTVDSGAKLDLSAMTGLGSSVDLTALSPDITGLVINAGVQPTGILDRFTSLKLTGSDTTIPTWATDGSLTAANATLDLSGMTGLGNPLDLSGISSDITTVILPTTVTEITVPSTVTVQLASGHSGVTALRLVGTDTTIPDWVTDGSLTFESGATLDLSEMTGLGSTLDLSTISSDITTIILPTTVTEITVPSTVTVQLESGHSGLTRINLTGSDPTIPVWATNGSLTVDSGATLDLSAMMGLGISFSFATITNSEIKTVILPNSISTTSDTSGWSQDSGTPTTWTRP